MRNTPIDGDVIAAHGRHFLIRLARDRTAVSTPVGSGPVTSIPAGSMATGSMATGSMAAGSMPAGSSPNPSLPVDVLPAVTRGRKGDVVVGDRVTLTQVSADQAVIESVAPRRNLVRRSDGFRTKAIAANVDQAIVVVSGHPGFDEALLLNVAIALAAESIPFRLAVTKIDLVDETRAIERRLSVWRTLGTPTDALSLKGTPRGLDALRAALAGRRTLLMGQSGMGKSTLVNALVPDAEQRTAAISEALSSGKHTTTFSREFALPGLDEQGRQGTIIDSPGFQAFGIAHLSTWEKAHAMPEFAPLLGQCRFNDCRHRDEPGCAIRQALEKGAIDPLRHRLFGAIRDD